jgi:plastocyanin
MTSFHRSVLSLLVGVAASLATSVSLAGNVTVTVTDADGKPAANVAVLLMPQARVALPPLPKTPVDVAQRDLQFAPFLTVVRTGSTLRFVNRDPYDHHVRSVPGGPLGSIAPAKDFEMRLNAVEGKRERSAELVVDKAGVIGLGCHLHSSMKGHVFVVDTPYFAKTDANGKATVEGVPDGGAELKLWHPEQLTDQPTQMVRVGGAAAVEANEKLNFVPKRRRGV